MKKFLTILSFVLSFVFSMPVHAHSDHHHGPPALKETAALEVATLHVKELVAKGKLTKDWESSKHLKTEKRAYKGTREWVVSFKNKKQILYVFMSLSGQFFAANFTGK